MRYAMTEVSGIAMVGHEKNHGSLSDFVRARRTELGMTHAQIAQRSGLSPDLAGQLASARKQQAQPHELPAHFASLSASLALVLPESPRLREVFESLILRVVVVNEAERYKHQRLAVSGLRLVTGAWLT